MNINHENLVQHQNPHNITNKGFDLLVQPSIVNIRKSKVLIALNLLL